MGDEARGDANAAWRASYRRVRKEPLRDDAATNRRRLERLGMLALPRTSVVLDLGAGDGNLSATLAAIGFDRVVGVEVQPELAAVPRAHPVVVGSADVLPLRPSSCDVVIAMDVLHHLGPAQLTAALAEVATVLRSGGWFLVCEPADTLLRRVLTRLLMSPLGRVTPFSRDKRAMVEAEAATLEPWLARERRFDVAAAAAGFRVAGGVRRGALHATWRLHAVPSEPERSGGGAPDGDQFDRDRLGG